ncbi:endonuclease/exonuclease/phosphatase family protein [Vibrio sp. TBV020]
MQKSWPLIGVLTLFGSFNSYAETVYSAWNLEWLSSTPSTKFKPSQREEPDYQSLSRHFESMNSDVVAFQEVNDVSALQRVIGNEYQIFFSHRAKPKNQHHQFSDINQYTGFAVKNGVSVIDKPDIRLDTSRNSKLRYASYIVVDSDSEQPIHTLSVHLKARCSGAYKSNKSCRTLKAQGEMLNDWIQKRETNGDAYIILGDFNHNLNYKGDWLWADISENSNAILATKKTEAKCKVKSRNNPDKTHQFRSLIDHIIVSSNLSFSSPWQDLYKIDDVLNNQMSDHCPVSTVIK